MPWVEYWGFFFSLSVSLCNNGTRHFTAKSPKPEQSLLKKEIAVLLPRFRGENKALENHLWFILTQIFYQQYLQGWLTPCADVRLSVCTTSWAAHWGSFSACRPRSSDSACPHHVLIVQAGLHPAPLAGDLTESATAGRCLHSLACARGCLQVEMELFVRAKQYFLVLC